LVLEEIMGHSKKGRAIGAARKTHREKVKLKALLAEAKKASDLSTWRRARAVLGYMQGRSVAEMSEDLGVVRSTINRWLQWYDAQGAEGLRTGDRTGAPRRLTDRQLAELADTIEAGPVAAGYAAGVWTGPMIGDWIHRHFGVRYHNHHIPRLLHSLGFSVQRPRKRLARADAEKQEYWLRKRFPAIKKRPPRAGG